MTTVIQFCENIKTTEGYTFNQWIVCVQIIFKESAAKSLQSCPTLCDPTDGSPPGSAIPGILQARTLEWVAISFSNVWKWKVKGKSLSRVWLFATPWTEAYQAPPSMGFSRQEYWSGVPLPSPLKKVVIFKRTIFEITNIQVENVWMWWIFSKHIQNFMWTSLVVQWLRLCAPNAGVWGSIPG